MGKKKRGVTVLKPFCYYCDKEFENANILLQHQKNRHFACKSCSRKFSTAASMSTHMSQVHNIAVTKVPNAKAGRDQVDKNVYGMEGVPAEVIEERLQIKVNKKRIKLEKELKLIGIDIDNPKFRLKDYEIPEPRPQKKKDMPPMHMYMGPPPGGLMPPGMVPRMGPPPGMMPGMPPPGMMMRPPPPDQGQQ
mmetsp:Transcript_11194/g.11260  ORF Transcript_11194/g.11260 Transcript_11194/m.11260 type:complete len:192 (-) Transcript_11194:27-602(-)